jgi:hypothetical protein
MFDFPGDCFDFSDAGQMAAKSSTQDEHRFILPTTCKHTGATNINIA